MPPKDRLLSIEINGLRDTRGRFAKVQGALPGIRRDELRALGRRVVEVLKEEAPTGKGEKPGQLKKGIRFRTYESGNDFTLRVTSAAPHTGYVVRGRGPVVAKRAMALRFVIDGTVIYRRRVGPAAPNPFHARAFARLMAEGEPEQTARKMARRIERAYTIA